MESFQEILQWVLLQIFNIFAEKKYLKEPQTVKPQVAKQYP